MLVHCRGNRQLPRPSELLISLPSPGYFLSAKKHCLAGVDPLDPNSRASRADFVARMQLLDPGSRYRRSVQHGEDRSIILEPIAAYGLPDGNQVRRLIKMRCTGTARPRNLTSRPRVPRVNIRNGGTRALPARSPCANSKDRFRIALPPRPVLRSCSSIPGFLLSP